MALIVPGNEHITAGGLHLIGLDRSGLTVLTVKKNFALALTIKKRHSAFGTRRSHLKKASHGGIKLQDPSWCRS